MTRQNQLIVSAIVVLIILLGLGGWFLFGRNQVQSLNSTTNKPQGANTGNSTIQSSITDLFTSGATKQCTFDVTGQNGGTTKGNIYVSGGKAYGDFDMTSNGKTSKTYLIRNDTTFYIWGDSLPSGIKMTMDVNEMATKMQGSGYSGFNPGEKANYNCSPWSVDESKFTPPSDVKFMDAGAMMPKTTGTPKTQTRTGTGTSDPCAQIADATTKAACENAMHNK